MVVSWAQKHVACAATTQNVALAELLWSPNTATKNRGYGFQGDPLRPITGKYYGYLIRAALY